MTIEKTIVEIPSVIHGGISYKYQLSLAQAQKYKQIVGDLDILDTKTIHQLFINGVLTNRYSDQLRF